jgi:hypothetical protein
VQPINERDVSKGEEDWLSGNPTGNIELGAAAEGRRVVHIGTTARSK